VVNQQRAQAENLVIRETRCMRRAYGHWANIRSALEGKLDS